MGMGVGGECCVVLCCLCRLSLPPKDYVHATSSLYQLPITICRSKGRPQLASKASERHCFCAPRKCQMRRKERRTNALRTKMVHSLAALRCERRIILNPPVPSRHGIRKCIYIHGSEHLFIVHLLRLLPQLPFSPSNHLLYSCTAHPPYHLAAPSRAARRPSSLFSSTICLSCIFTRSVSTHRALSATVALQVGIVLAQERTTAWTGCLGHRSAVARLSVPT